MLCAALLGPGHDAVDPDEAWLMGRLAAGDASAVAGLYDRHGRLVFSLAFRMLQDEAEAEHVVQDVFVQAWQQASRYSRARGSVSTWLLAIARSRALDRLRARRVRLEGSGAPADDMPYQVHAATDAPEGAGSGGDPLALRRAFIDLPLAQRIALELVYFEGHTLQEIAERMEAPTGTIARLIQDGLVTLRDALAQHPGARA